MRTRIHSPGKNVCYACWPLHWLASPWRWRAAPPQTSFLVDHPTWRTHNITLSPTDAQQSTEVQTKILQLMEQNWRFIWNQTALQSRLTVNLKCLGWKRIRVSKILAPDLELCTVVWINDIVKISVAGPEPVEPKLFETWSRSRN